MNNRGEILRYLEAEIRSGTPAHTLRLLHEELVRLLRVLASLPSNDPARESAHRAAADIVEELVRALAAGSGSPFEDLLSAYATLGTELAATCEAPSPALDNSCKSFLKTRDDRPEACGGKLRAEGAVVSNNSRAEFSQHGTSPNRLAELLALMERIGRLLAPPKQ